MGDTSFHCDDHSFLSIIQADNPYRTTFLTCHGVALLVFLVSSSTGNLSQVDKLWSLLPTVYAWMCVVDSRTAIMAGLATLWSIRLTYNFYRRGGYVWPPWQGDEDYRWECLRRGELGGWWTLLMNKRVMILFNIVFISLYQNYLLLYIASPSLVAWSSAMRGIYCSSSGEGGENMGSPSPLNICDAIASFLFVTALIVETIADKQQHNFQKKKREWKLSLEPGGGFANAIKSISATTSLEEYRNGFCRSGLFAIVRKPAYASEQAIWISYYLFSVSALHSGDSHPAHYWNWSGGGFALLCILFQGSGWMTERISISKYPAYRVYQQEVPLYVPSIASLFSFISGVDREDAKKE